MKSEGIQLSWKKVSEQKSPQKMNFGECEKEGGGILDLHYTIARTKKFPGQSEAPQFRLCRHC